MRGEIVPFSNGHKCAACGNQLLYLDRLLTPDFTTRAKCFGCCRTYVVTERREFVPELPLNLGDLCQLELT